MVLPKSMSCAKTIACVHQTPSSPTHHFVELIVGEFITNCSASMSKVAVVSSDCTSDP